MNDKQERYNRNRKLIELANRFPTLGELIRFSTLYARQVYPGRELPNPPVGTLIQPGPHQIGYMLRKVLELAEFAANVNPRYESAARTDCKFLLISADICAVEDLGLTIGIDDVAGDGLDR